MTRKYNDYESLINDVTVNCSALHLPDKIKNEALAILKRYLKKKKSLRGKNMTTFSVGLILVSCHKWNYPMTAKMINNILDIDSLNTKGELLITRIGKDIVRITEEKFAPISLNNYVEMIQGKIGSSTLGTMTSLMILNYMERENIVIGYNNPALASAISYISDRIAGDRFNENEYTQIVGTTEISLRTYKRKLIKAIPNIKKYGTKYKWIQYPTP